MYHNLLALSVIYLWLLCVSWFALPWVWFTCGSSVHHDLLCPECDLPVAPLCIMICSALSVIYLWLLCIMICSALSVIYLWLLCIMICSALSVIYLWLLCASWFALPWVWFTCGSSVHHDLLCPECDLPVTALYHDLLCPECDLPVAPLCIMICSALSVIYLWLLCIMICSALSVIYLWLLCVSWFALPWVWFTCGSSVYHVAPLCPECDLPVAPLCMRRAYHQGLDHRICHHHSYSPLTLSHFLQWFCCNPPEITGILPVNIYYEWYTTGQSLHKIMD